LSHRELIAGLDVGTTKICAVIAEVVSDTPGQPGTSQAQASSPIPNVLGVGISPCVGLRKGVVIDIDATTAAIQDAVRRAERMAGEQIHSVVVGVTGEHIACLNSRSVIAISHPGREISSSDMDRLMDAAQVLILPPDREIIHAIPRWFSVDGQVGVATPVGMHGNRLEVETHIVTGLSSFIQNVVKCVHQAGLAVDSTVLEPIATGESVLLPAEMDLGVAVADIGGGTTDVAVYVGGRIYHSCVVPVGGNHVTRDIAIGLRADIEESERVKIEYGCAMTAALGDAAAFDVTSMGSNVPRHLPQRVLAEIIEPRITELCTLIMRELDKAGCRDRVPAGLVFTGGGSLMPGLPELATRITGLAARVGAPSGVIGLVDAVGDPSCATAVGLVLFTSRFQAKQGIEKGLHSWISMLMDSDVVRKIKGLVTRFTGN